MRRTMMRRDPPKKQVKLFQEKAKELGCDESEEAFDEALHNLTPPVDREPAAPEANEKGRE
jgi:hypothetical protein